MKNQVDVIRGFVEEQPIYSKKALLSLLASKIHISIVPERLCLL